MSSAAAESIDGRTHRTLRSRRAICDACLDLVEEGTLQPSADEIAQRAGVSRRSIFNHFADLGELYDAVAEAGMQRCAPLLAEISIEAPVEQRLERLVAVRAKFLEATAAFTRALTAQALVGPMPDQAIRVSRAALELQHAEVERLFVPELEGHPQQVRDEIIEAMSAVLSPLSWEFLRRSRGNSQSRTRAVVKRTLAAILRDAGVRV